MHQLLCFLFVVATVLAFGADPAPAPAIPRPVERSVVKIFATVRPPDPIRPWSKAQPREVSGSGVVIDGHRILTNAHIVAYASQLQVQGHESGERVPATVEHFAPGIDLAVLKVDDETFFAERPPLPRAPRLPIIKEAVMAYGFPTGGTSLAITKGIVSRIEFVGYNYPVAGLRIQIDAAINAGNSGGPALIGDEMAGIAFGRLGGGDNIGYIIPNEEIDLFLADVADGRYDGKPTVVLPLQTLQNPALRSYLRVPKGTSGIVVTPEPDLTAPLRAWDVIARIGDTVVDDEGMVRLAENLRVRFLYLVQRLARDGHVPVQVLRNGRPIDLSIPVDANRHLLIRALDGSYPPYFIYGPLVFSRPSAEMFASSSTSAATMMNALGRAGSPLITRRHERPAFDGEELVIVSSPLFSHRLGRGYSNPTLRVVEKVNGTSIRNLPHLVEVLRDLASEFAVFDFAGEGAESIVLPRGEVEAATEDILADNGIRARGSPELLAVWNAAPAR